MKEVLSVTIENRIENAFWVNKTNNMKMNGKDKGNGKSYANLHTKVEKSNQNQHIVE